MCFINDEFISLIDLVIDLIKYFLHFSVPKSNHFQESKRHL